jgi:phosphoenolpyruvate-protein phosphotransferase
LHARPAKVFVKLAKQYQSNIRVFHGEKKANAKSMISLLTLGVESGSTIRIETEGEDEKIALTALIQAIEEGLGEAELIEEHGEAHSAEAGSAAEKQKPNEKETAPLPPLAENMLKGISGAPGIAIGPIYHLKKTEITVEETFENESVEKNQLQTAIEQAKGQVARLKTHMLAQKADSEAAIFDVHLELLDDADLLDGVIEKINQQQSAAKAWQLTIDERAKVVAGLDDPLLAARAADLHDIGYRVLRILVGVDGESVGFPDHPVIVVADDLSPSDTASLDRDKVLGFCTASGGPTSHTAIIARALSLPAVVSAGMAVLGLEDGITIVLNGGDGLLTLNPSKDEISQAKSKQKAGEESLQAAQEKAAEPAITKDGHRVEIAANIGGASGARDAMKSGAEGVGLLRTEFLFLERRQPPSEDEQFAVYREIAEIMEKNPVIVRTLDVGGDKPLPYISMPDEENPFLGVRGIRLCLAQPDLLREQLRAVLRATKYGKLRIMFPMVADISEWRAARAMVEEIRAELGVALPEMGIMIEVPSAALMADVFAEEVDFFSVGTNDLTQYTMAMDRMHPQLAGKADGLHPAVLRLISKTVKAAHKAGKWVGICGELGADMQAVPILVGLGVDELSVTVPAIPTVKAKVRELEHVKAQDLAEKALACGSATGVRDLVKSFDEASA